jgi:hypothetical protein
MSVVAQGTINGRAAAVRYDNGALDGDALALALIRRAVFVKLDTCIPGMTGGEASLDNDLSAAATFVAVFDRGVRLNVQSPLLADSVSVGDAQ